MCFVVFCHGIPHIGLYSPHQVFDQVRTRYINHLIATDVLNVHKHRNYPLKGLIKSNINQIKSDCVMETMICLDVNCVRGGIQFDPKGTHSGLFIMNRKLHVNK